MSDYLTEGERELRRLAKVATDMDGKGSERFLAMGHFHAHATPYAVLSLLARIEALTEVAKAVESMTADVAENGTCADCPYVSSERAKELLAIIRRERP